MLWFSILICAYLGLLSTAVDKGNFKTCDQSGFCKRHRALVPRQSPYVVLWDSLSIQSSRIYAELRNVQTGVVLSLEVTTIVDNTARLKITEVKPIRARYEPPIGDVLIAEPARQNFVMKQRDESTLLVAFENNQVAITADPFRVDFYINYEPVISVNTKGLLKFEHYRLKSSSSEKEKQEDGKEEDKAAEGEEKKKDEEEVKQEEKKEDQEEPAMWEETFKSHTDSKPFGPSSVGIDISLPGFEFVYGIPEHAETLALKSTKSTDPYRLYNADVFEYELHNPMALYGSVPVMLAHNEKRTVGLFWLNAAETWVDIASNMADKNLFSKVVHFVTGGANEELPQVDTHWFSEAGIIDVFIMLGPTANDVFRQYARLTGSTPLPPLFAIAYHQSRWNYNDEKDVESVDAGFDEHDVPMDVIWLDIEHTDGKRYFTWDSHKFPDSERMLNSLSAKGRKMVTIIDPHIKRDDGYHIHKEAQERGHYVKSKDGNDYEGWCWPGTSSWLDFLNPEVRAFWAANFLPSAYVGSTRDLYTWNDMNEPSVFNGPEVTMYKDAKHHGDLEHREVHNLYGMLVHRATMEGQLLRSDHKERTFVLSRAFFSGSQRYGAVWTGDNTGDWDHLKISLPMLMTLNLVGMTFSGADVGGFFKNPDTELLTRWYQAAAYQPFFRAHAHVDTRRREPWLQPPEHLKAIRAAIRARYSLLPYWYTLFYNTERNGQPPMKPLWVDFPTDKKTFAIQDQHLVGSALLVRPVTDFGASGVDVYLPGGVDEIWYDIDTYKSYPGGSSAYIAVNLEKIPVLQRGGFVVPRRQRMRRSSSLTYHDPFTLVVTLDKQGQASGDLYIDDYITLRYKDGEFAHRNLTFSNGKLSSTNLNPSWESSSFNTDAWLEKVLVVGLPRKPNKVELKRPGLESTLLAFMYEPEKSLLTIRKPAVNVVKDWVIELL